MTGKPRAPATIPSAERKFPCSYAGPWTPTLDAVGSTPVASKFIQTDQVSEISELQRDLASVHEGHQPMDHICEGCQDIGPDACWHRRHGKDAPAEQGGVRRLHDRNPDECSCLCHHLVDQCLLSQTAGRDEGKPLYRLEDDIDGWSIVMPQSVYEHFQTIPEAIRQQAMDKMIQHARSQVKPPANTPDPR